MGLSNTHYSDPLNHQVQIDVWARARVNVLSNIESTLPQLQEIQESGVVRLEQLPKLLKDTTFLVSFLKIILDDQK